MIAARRNTGGRTRGLCGQGLLLYHVNDADNVVAFQRWFDHGPGDDVVVIVNMGATDRESYRVGMPAAGAWHVRIDTGSSSYGETVSEGEAAVIDVADEPGDGLPASATMIVPAYSVIILSQDMGDRVGA